MYSVTLLDKAVQVSGVIEDSHKQLALLLRFSGLFIAKISFLPSN